MLYDFEPLVYRVASISKLFWQEYINYFEDARSMVRVGTSKLFAFPSFTLEVFHRLYYESEPEQLDPPPPESAWAILLHREFEQLISFDTLVEQCQGNQLAAGLATVEYCRQVYEKLPPPMPRFLNPQQYRDLIKQLKHQPEIPPSGVFEQILTSPQTTSPTGLPLPKTRQQRERQQWLRQLIEDSGDRSDELVQLLQREGKQAVWQAQQYADSFDETQVRQMLRAALNAAHEKLSEVAGWLEMLGLSWGNEIGGERSVSPAEKMALAQKIAGHAKLKKIAVVAGRFQQIAERKRRSQALDAFGEITTIELENNLSRLLPTELQKLSASDLFPLFALGYYDRSLLQYKTRGKEKQCKGPLVVCLDSSGSMDGLPDTWAKAVTAVLGQIALREGRHLRVIHFATRVCRVDDFPPHHHDFSRLLESMLAFYNGGGTAWEPALLSGYRMY
ncbi:VWA domain-containing protein [Chroococcidiopsis sp. FACHB-1243]|uniref:vWA domain-containing protein n=1 Tax=Chroococcidiopsis sp. [FACHB-1243] TaxID=2692781 RepID=UPI0017803361|nr:VWA domain-containing protein [Chroococcidiopsis sp. [FACHB-1243]]MBD2309400.1 VWA domain-containing protein [Chroococcidiopsis sp. [FACHB-1243]]